MAYKTMKIKQENKGKISPRFRGPRAGFLWFQSMCMTFL